MHVQVFACGNSKEGKLGQGEDKPDASLHEPGRVVGLEDVTAIRVVAGAFHTLVLTSTGTVPASSRLRHSFAAHLSPRC
jgi:alpha-tubulin suppressor-like RCC1 family protein